MRTARRSKVATLVLAAAVLPGPALAVAPAGPAAAAEPSLADVRQEAASLRARVDAVAERLAAATSTYETSRHDLGVATAEQVGAQHALETAESSQARERAALRTRVRGLYTSGGGVGVLAGLVSGGDPADLLSRAALLEDVLSADREALRDAERARVDAERAQEAAEAAARHQVAVDAALVADARRLEALLDEQRRLLDEADARVRRLVESEEQARARARSAALADEAASTVANGRAVPGGTGSLPGSQSGGSSSDPGRSYRPVSAAGMACPVGAVHSFTDTWLASRSGGRQHQGTDVFAPHGSLAYAVVDGVVDKVGNGGLGGITLWIRSGSGDRFYYAHNSANLVAVGDRVTAGQPVARVGRTGNAATTPPHVHFEAHPGGGAAANPYALLKALCG